MLRAVEWCQIGGFEHWWLRLARELTEDVLSRWGGEGMARRFALQSGHFCPTLELCEVTSLCGASWTLGKERGVAVRWTAHRGKGSHGLLYYGSNMTTVRNLKDEVDKRAYHKMLKQLCLSERDFE